MRASLALLASILAACVAGGCAGGSADSESAAPAERFADWRGNGLAVRFPQHWQRASTRLTPYLSDPVEVLALATYPLRPGGDRCSHQPVNALEDLGPRDALLVLYERAEFTPEGYPPRAGAPELVTGANRACVRAGRRDAWIAFGENGRAFYALLVLGLDAPQETHDELVAIYESLTIDRR